ncbi:YlaH-like protein [Marininema mesophilum]|uniref:YlaH-like protein n=1 Tax=Marininema mesophilum TaxID=1048340 RepID=A0A1H2QJK2_9BACL|nr:YlaH-like family protein [Marininema mesophilum]SDW07090.1 YlaH-like protein [Marininema mesophilum]
MEGINEWLRGEPALAYLLILVLTSIIYKVAFARRLPILKAAVVYVVLAIGCILFWALFFLKFPMIEILSVTVVMIAIARIRMGTNHRKEQEGPPTTS